MEHKKNEMQDQQAEMKDKHAENGIGRRTFLKTMGVAALGIGASALPISPRFVQLARAQQPCEGENYGGCRIVVFGSDSLRIDYAKEMWNGGQVTEESPALSRLNEPICATCGGLSSTQPGWASIWSGLPSEKIKCWANGRFEAMPAGFHIVEKLAKPEAYGENLYIVWITGKGHNIMGSDPESPHHAVYKLIMENGQPGIYLGDEGRTDVEVLEAAGLALEELKYQENFICFIHFRNPDHKGHQVAGEVNDYTKYMNKARAVDKKIYELMGMLPPDTDIIYCSDHGFDFQSQGDPRDAHKFSPYGMLATNFDTLPKTDVSQMTIGRLIYKRAGGNPDCTTKNNGTLYRMFGEDLVEGLL